MRTTTIVCGALLFLVAPLAFALNGMHFKMGQALAAVFGLALLGCGLASTTTKSTKMAMHVAVGLALLAFIGSLFGKGGLNFGAWLALLTGHSPQPGVAVSTLGIFLICGFFVARSVLWFLGNRSSRKAA